MNETSDGMHGIEILRDELIRNVARWEKVRRYGLREEQIGRRNNKIWSRIEELLLGYGARLPWHVWISVAMALTVQVLTLVVSTAQLRIELSVWSALGYYEQSECFIIPRQTSLVALYYGKH